MKAKEAEKMSADCPVGGDGVAQQPQQPKKKKKKEILLPFDSLNFTPGTMFMTRLKNALSFWVRIHVSVPIERPQSQP